MCAYVAVKGELDKDDEKYQETAVDGSDVDGSDADADVDGADVDVDAVKSRNEETVAEFADQSANAMNVNGVNDGIVGKTGRESFAVVATIAADEHMAMAPFYDN